MLFNKEVDLRREIKTYEDFQNYVNDDDLIDGAYKIGVIGWEASKILRHAKETRHIFSGHPKSSDPSILKVLSVIDDCIKYVLNAEYPSKIIDIDEYIEILKSKDFDRNTVAIENAIGDLPEGYKNILIHKLYTIYIQQDSSSTLVSNIEFVAPILWKVLPKAVKVPVVRRVDQEISKGSAATTERSFDFVRVVGGMVYLSHTARRYKVSPLVEKLKYSLDDWPVEDACVKELSAFSQYIPEESVNDYVWALTHTYVGKIGSSRQFARTDFYADGAAGYIPAMFQVFDDRMAHAFVEVLRESSRLKTRLRNPSKLRRLRSLAIIALDKASESFEDRAVLEVVADESKEEELMSLLRI